MKQFIYSTFLIFLFSACENNTAKTDVFGKEEVKIIKSSNFEERVRREIEVKLDIPVKEKFDLKIHFAYLNADEKKDAIITINRLDYAMDQAAKAKNTATRAEFGYLGNFNYFFYYDGKLDKISVPIKVGSSAKSPLKLTFNSIQSDIYQDISIEYRIKNAAFRSYYLIENGSCQLVFQWKIYDKIGQDSYEANYIKYDEGTLGLTKDILIYKGKIKNYSKNVKDLYKYNPTIENSNEELYRFFYDERTRKYMTRKK